MSYDTRQANPEDHVELRKTYCSDSDQISVEIVASFNDRNSKLPAAL